MYLQQNVKKPKGGGPGAAVPNKPNVTFAKAEDVLTWPQRDANGVKMLGNFVMKEGAKMWTVYFTPSKQKPNFAGEGDEDMEAIKQQYEAIFPGDTLEFNEFVQNMLGEKLVIIAGNCLDDATRVYGTECSPMRMLPNYESSNSGRMHTLNFEQIVATKNVPGHYYGTLSFAEPTATDESVDVTEANGTQYKLDSFAVTAAIDVASIDHSHGTYITLIGSGGADPATLSSGAGTAATVLLKDDTDWVALADATITFRVFDADGTIYLVEESRS